MKAYTSGFRRTGKQEGLMFPMAILFAAACVSCVREPDRANAAPPAEAPRAVPLVQGQPAPAVRPENFPPPPQPEAPAAKPLLAAADLDTLVAPIALHPDPLLAQLLPASTYPLEVVAASRWAQENKGIKPEAVETAVAKRDWAPSVKSLCAFPDVLKYMDEHLDWTMQLGDAVLNQEQDVLDAVQRMRAKAQAAGTLQSNDKQTVEVEKTDNREVIVIQPAEPEIVYVPVYDPQVVYYPPSYTVVEDYWPTDYISFGFGVSVGSWFWNWDCDWNDRYIVWDDDCYRRRHYRIDWDDVDWDRFDWRHCDRFRHRGHDIDLAWIDIDNIDINRCDWRHADLRHFDWNRVNWRDVRLDRLDLRRGNWRDLDWHGAGIRNPHLIDRLRGLPEDQREAVRAGFERGRHNQQFKDRIAGLQREHRSDDKGRESRSQFETARWEHNPVHRRGVSYRGPVGEHFQKVLGEGPSRRVEGFAKGQPGTHFHAGKDSGQDRGSLDSLRQRSAGESFRNLFGGDRRREDDAGRGKTDSGNRTEARRTGNPFEGLGNDADRRSGDQDHARRILDSLRQRSDHGTPNTLFGGDRRKESDRDQKAPSQFTRSQNSERGRSENRPSIDFSELFRQRSSDSGNRSIFSNRDRDDDGPRQFSRSSPSVQRHEPPQIFRQPEKSSRGSQEFNRSEQPRTFRPPQQQRPPDMSSIFREQSKRSSQENRAPSFERQNRSSHSESSNRGSGDGGFKFERRDSGGGERSHGGGGERSHGGGERSRGDGGSDRKKKHD